MHAFFAVRNVGQPQPSVEGRIPPKTGKLAKTPPLFMKRLTLLFVALFACALPGATEGAVAVIEGINFDEDGANNGGSFFVPPCAGGAIGLHHVVSVVQSSIEWHSKTGVQQNSQRLGKTNTITGSFFAPLVPQNQLFSAKVLYDQYEDRFVVAALERQDTANGDAVNSSRILLAVSASGDPNGAWRFQAIDSRLNIGGLERWTDTLGLAIDEEAVYLSANMIAFGAGGNFGGSRLWILEKGVGSGGLYDGGLSSTPVYDPYLLVGFPGFTQSTQPAQVFGAGGVAPGVGTFFVSYGGITDGRNEALSILRVNNPLGKPTFFHQLLVVGDIDKIPGEMPDAPQAGTSVKIDTNDRRVLGAIWRGNSLWVTAQVVPPTGPDANQATAHWWQIDTSNLSALVVTQQGNVGGEDIAPGTHTFFPSIAVDAFGNIGIGFAASGPTIFPGAYFTGRLASDPAGTTRPTQTVASGQSYYVRTLGSGVNRWGEYSSVAVDPEDEVTLWAFNQYALARGTVIAGEDGRWGTRFGWFTFGPGPVCGNGEIEVREGCDDGNTSNGDGCDSTCQVESCFVCLDEPSACTPNPACSTTLNHFLFYQVRPSPGFSSFSPRIVNLLDSFEGKDFQVKRPLALGNPANVNGAAPAASSQPEHLEAYLIREKAGEPRYEKRTRIQVDNELGSIRVDTIIPDRLLVPTATSVHGAASPLNPESIDHFKCYTVRVTPSTAKFSEGIRRSIVDQFNQEKWYDLRKPAHLCTPVNKNGEHPGAEDHLVHLMCYQVKPAKDQPKHQKVLGLSVANQFGEERLDTIVEEELCIPSSVTFPETNVTTP